MKNKFNNLLKYIYDYSDKTMRKETINSLFCAVLEPLIQYQKVEADVFLKILDIQNKNSSLQRIKFSNVQIHNFDNNNQKQDIWGNTEFVVVLSARYSACLIWDYSDCDIKDSSRVCLLYNSRIIQDIAKLISDNSIIDLKGIVKKYAPDRRENAVLNKSIQSIALSLNDKNQEFLYSQNSLEFDNEKILTAQIINEKAKFIAHEIRNYISIINLYSTIAKKNLQQNNIQSIEYALSNINNASDNISYLISDLRCMSNSLISEVDINNLIDNSIKLCQAKLERSKASIKFKNKEKIILKTDKVKVECALTNIIFNALDANAKNITILLDNNKIFIKNDGDKIEKTIKNKIFDYNFTTKQNGNGIGLAFCKQQLQLINGDINLISSDEKETIFEIKVA